ncbi:MAG: hypothetical protein LBG60_09170 [Bifidobacteriaceae bacterium]|jgi:hypothetical protein|nr:hypothetical protein [Bifidobacteriaceae bacterium]
MGKRVLRRSFAAAAVSVVMASALVGCGEDKKYDIGPIFPLTADKCEKYNGEKEGEGLTESCWVGKEDCERAAADWAEAMENVPDAIVFTCPE